MTDRYDEVFRAMADGHRRRILAALCREPMVAGELARLVGLAANAVSFHLKWLKSAGLVSIRREGRYLRYHAEAGAVSDWQAHVGTLFVPAAGAVPGSSGTRGEARTSAARGIDEMPPPESPVPVTSEAATDRSADTLPTELL